MLGVLLVWPFFAATCAGSLFRPKIGVVGYYAFVLLQPEWNWRWSLPPEFPYQKYIAICTLVGLVMNGVRGNRWNTPALLSVGGLIGFLALAWISTFGSIDAMLSQGYMGYLWKVVLMTIVAVHVLDSPRAIMALSCAAIVAQGYNALQINLDYFERGYCLYALRPWGDNGDNNLYSILTVPLLATSAAVMVCSRPAWPKVAAGAVLTLQMHQIMLMESRGCMLGCLLMVPLLLWWMPKTSWNLYAVVVAAVMGSILAGPPVVREFMSSFAKDGERDSSAESRFDLWRAGMAITADYPLLGVGPYAGQRLVPKYGDFGGAPLKGLHNLFFEISTGCGIPALVLYLMFFAVAWWLSVRALWLRQRRPLPEWAESAHLAAAVGLPGYFAASMFSSGALLESSYIVATLAIATHLIIHRRSGPGELDDDSEGGDQNELGEAVMPACIVTRLTPCR